LANSSVFRFAALAYSQVGAKSFGSPHILENLRIPRFVRTDPRHQRLADLGRDAAEGAGVDDDISEAAASVWGISPKELQQMARGFAELSRVAETRTKSAQAASA
jgi:hypothetical protein